MAYATRLTPEAEWSISPITSKLAALKPGDILTIKAENPQRLNSIRSWLYTYFRINNLKSKFKLRSDNLTQLSLLACDLSFIEVKTSASPFTPIETFVIENLLACETLDEASAIARSALTAGEITEEDLLLIIEEWESRVGQASHSRGTTTYQSQGPPRNQGLVEKPSSKPLNGTIEKSEGEGGRDE